MKKLTLLFTLLSIIPFTSKGVNYQNDGDGTDYGTASNWTSNSAPPTYTTEGNSTAYIGTTTDNYDMIIDNDFTAEANEDFDFVIRGGSVLYIDGDVNLQNNSNCTFSIRANSTVIILGDYNPGNNSGSNDRFSFEDNSAVLVVTGTMNAGTVNSSSGNIYSSAGGPSSGSFTTSASTTEGDLDDLAVDFPGIYALLSALPVQYKSFDVEASEKQLIFNWATLNETNNDYFTIEYSTDLINFHEIKTVDGALNSNTLIEYSTTVEDFTTKGQVYFRLKQTDVDQRFSYSEVVSLSIPYHISVFPNPAVNHIEIDHDIESNSSTLELVNFSSGNSEFEISLNENLIDLSSLPEGVYFLESENLQVKTKFIIQR